MSRKRVVEVEDSFDDDTDLPLPSRPLLNTSAKGPLLQEIDSDDDDDDEEEEESDHAGPASSPSQAHFSSQLPKNSVTDITPYKSWTCIYPIYIDAKRPYGTGQRRVGRAKSIWWPLSKDIAEATNRLGLGTLHEVGKIHPRDWENPGRVRVQWKKEGRLMNPSIKTKKQLLEMISLQIQLLKPEHVPTPPYAYSSSSQAAISSSSSTTATTTLNKGKAPASGGKSKSLIASTLPPPPAPHSPKPGAGSGGRRSVPVPPLPHPPLSSRVSPYSPALSTGVLIETVKAGMNASSDAGGPGGNGAGPGPQKGKRKVVRVRG